MFWQSFWTIDFDQQTHDVCTLVGHLEYFDKMFSEDRRLIARAPKDSISQCLCDPKSGSRLHSCQGDPVQERITGYSFGWLGPVGKVKTVLLMPVPETKQYGLHIKLETSKTERNSEPRQLIAARKNTNRIDIANMNEQSLMVFVHTSTKRY